MTPGESAHSVPLLRSNDFRFIICEDIETIDASMNPSAKAIAGPVCKITCFEQKKVARIKAKLAKEEHLLPKLADLYKLLGNTTRLKILLALAQDELCVCDIAHVLGLTVAATSHQLKLLRDQGWLAMRNDGKMVYYRLHSEGLLKVLKGDFSLLAKRLAGA